MMEAKMPSLGLPAADSMVLTDSPPLSPSRPRMASVTSRWTPSRPKISAGDRDDDHDQRAEREDRVIGDGGARLGALVGGPVRGGGFQGGPQPGPTAFGSSCSSPALFVTWLFIINENGRPGDGVARKRRRSAALSLALRSARRARCVAPPHWRPSRRKWAWKPAARSASSGWQAARQNRHSRRIRSVDVVST